MQRYDVIVIGAGASGLMCAATAATRGRSVCLLEGTDKPGKKILMSGGGRCNFTNLTVDASNYHCQNPHFTKAALSRYSQWDFIALVERYGIAYHERDHGQLFCDDSAKQILQMLLAECECHQVTLISRCRVEAVMATGGYQLETSQGRFQCDSLVVATGGLSIPTLGGATGLGYQLATQFGLPVLPSSAGLVPFVFTDELKPVCEKLSGTALWVTISCNGHSFTENMLFTHRGLSGPAVLQISNYWMPGEAIAIDLLPEVDTARWLQQAKVQYAKSLLRSVLSQQLPKKLVAELEALMWHPLKDKPIAEFPDNILSSIAEELNQWRVKPSGTEGYRTAEVTRGGVDTDVLSSKTMECKEHKGLYFIGEVVDVTGHLGGFNFQWAWSSGYAAGQWV